MDRKQTGPKMKKGGRKAIVVVYGALATLIACSGGARDSNSVASEGLDDERLRLGRTVQSAPAYEAEAHVVEARPDELWVQVSASNADSQAQEITYGVCSLHLQLQSTDREARTLTWRSAGRRERRAREDIIAVCPDYLAISRLAPGQTIRPDEFRARIPIAEILGDSLPEGVYTLTVSLAVDEDTVWLPPVEVRLVDHSGANTSLPLNAELRYSADVHVLGSAQDTVALTVHVSNTTIRPVMFEYGSSWQVRAYSDPQGTGDPAWSRWTMPGDAQELESGWLHPRTIRWRVVGSGQSIVPEELSHKNPVHEILGDSLPPGRYFFEARLRLPTGRISVHAGGVSLRSGS